MSRINGVSIVVPAYNGSRWIAGSIRSLLAQDTPVPLEVVVVDDVSTDDTVEVVKRVGDPRVRLVKSERNRGVAGARNLGVQEALYDWVAFNDQDDIWLPHKLRKQVDLLEKHHEFDGVAGGAGRLARDGQSQWSARFLFWQWTPVHVLHPKCAPAYDPRSDGATYLQTLLVAKQAIKRAGGFREKLPLSDDLDLFMKLADVSKLACLEEPLFLYRLGQDNQTAPDKADAVKFLAAHAYYAAAMDARKQGMAEPDPTDFFSRFSPPHSEIEEFRVRQGMRNVNTRWVNEGATAAVREIVRQVVRDPKRFSVFFSKRLSWWLKRDRQERV